MMSKLFLVIMLTVGLQPSPPKYPVITTQNAQQLTQVGLIGRGYVTEVAWSPDGKLLAVSGATGIWLYSANALNLPPRLVAEGNAPIGSITFSPDGSKLAYSSGMHVALWDIISGHRQALPTESTDTVAGFAFSPDGTLLAATVWHYPPPSERPLEREYSIQLWNVSTGKFVRSYPDGTVPGFRFSPDGK